MQGKTWDQRPRISPLFHIAEALLDARLQGLIPDAVFDVRCIGDKIPIQVLPLRPAANTCFQLQAEFWLLSVTRDLPHTSGSLVGFRTKPMMKSGSSVAVSGRMVLNKKEGAAGSAMSILVLFPPISHLCD